MAKTPDQEPGGEFGGFNQDEIDALFGGGNAAEDSQDQSPSEDASSAEVSQSDIDALFGGGSGQGETGESTASKDAGAPAAGAEAASEQDAPPDERLDSLGRPFDDVAAAMQAAIEEETGSAGSIDTAGGEPDGAGADATGAQPFVAPTLDGAGDSGTDLHKVTMLSDVRLRVRIELGKTRMRVEDVLRLGEGSVVELDKHAGDPVDVIVNDRLVARGEVLVLNDSFCVRISEVLSNDPHRITT